MFRQLRHRQTKGAANSRVGANITAPHLDSTVRIHTVPHPMISFRRMMLVSALASAVSTSAAAQDPLREALENLFGAAGEYLAAGYQRAYLDTTACGRLSKRGTNSHEESLREIASIIPSDQLREIRKSMSPMLGQLRTEVDQELGSASAFSCGKTEGILDGSLRQSRAKWQEARVRFFRVRDGGTK